MSTDCSGIGSPEQALKKLGVDHEIIFSCEKDKHARQTYLANHCPGVMFDDMSVRDNSPIELYSDLYVAGIPCQPFSLAGKRLGESDVRGTLFYNSYDYIQKQNPKFFIIENVKGLLSADKGRIFRNWLELLAGTINYQEQLYPHPDCLNYHVHHTVLNSVDFGVPQNRERVFILGVRSDLPNNFHFPVGTGGKKTLKDILEKNVDRKYYLSEKMLEYFNTIKANFNAGKLNLKHEDDIASTITRSSSSLDISDNLIVVNDNGNLRISENVTCLDANYHKGMDNHAQRTMVIESNEDNPIVHSTFPRSSKSGKGGVGPLSKNDGTTYALDTTPYSHMAIQLAGSKIRRLTPLECFRLQGFPDSFVKPVSDTQLYRQAGNSITVNVMKAILKNLLSL